jgi:4-amino-4-deoxy-L-arabinose transferase-like glycosyltransferase
LAAGLVFVSLYVSFCVEIFRDVSGRYAPMARAFAEGDWSAAFNISHPPLTPVLGGCAAWLMGLEPFSALMLVSGLFYVLAALPLYLILREFLESEFEAALGASLYLLAPKIIKIGCLGLLEPARNFFFLAALALAFGNAKEAKAWKQALFGLCLACLTLTRSESAAFLPVLLLAFALLAWEAKGFARSWEALCGLGAGLLTALAFLAAGLLPRIVQVFHITGIPALDKNQATYAKHLLGYQGFENLAALETTIDATQRTHGLFGPERIADWLMTLLSGAYPVYFAFAIAGLVLLAKGKSLQLKHWLLLGLSAYVAALYFALNLSPRYFNVMLPLLMCFTVIGIVALYRSVSQRGKAIFLALAAIVLLLQVWSGLESAFSKDRLPEKKLGLWLKGNAQSLLGENRAPGRLKIASSDSAVNYWAGAEFIHIKKFAPSLEGSQLDGADFVVVLRKRARLVEELDADPRFKPLQTPAGAKIAVYAKRSTDSR